VTTRYPAEEEEVTRDEALRAIDLAALVSETVKRGLVMVLGEVGENILPDCRKPM
jgi:hypothetical protein